MSGSLEYAAPAGRVRGSANLVDGLVRAVGGAPDEPGAGSAERAEVEAALRASGAGTFDQLDGPLSRTLAPVRAPIVQVRLERDHDVALVWASADAACFLTTVEAGVSQVVSVPVAALPGALSRYLRVSPRPRLTPAVDVALAPADLASAIAAGRAPASLPPGQGRAVLEASLGQLRSHWRATSRWAPAGESTGGRVVEVVDTDAGMWLVVADGPMVELWPTTPTTVVLALCELVPRNAELDLPGVGDHHSGV